MEKARGIETKVFTFIEKHHMFRPGERVVVGVSGGADSVCLLFVLTAWAKEKGLSLHVVHVNHGIRREAGEDAAYVERLCGELGIPFTLVERDVRTLAAERKCSEEEAGRDARYEAFDRLADETGAARIAVAHNRNDQAETMLFHLFRGTGLAGLCGMRPVRGRIVRPLLCLERDEIEAYLAEKGIPYCRDATNEEDAYTRNRIRHHILSYAEAEIVHGSVSHMGRTAEQLLEIEEYLENQTAEAYRAAVKEDGERLRVECEAFRQLPGLIRKRLLLLLLQRSVPGARDIGQAHVTAVEELFLRTGNGAYCLPHGVLARRQYGEGILEPAAKEEGISSGELAAGSGERYFFSLEKESCLQGEQRVRLPGAGSLIFSVFPYEKSINIPKNEYTKWFDYDKINKMLTVRTRNSGDFLSISGGMHQPLKKFMIDRRIPVQERNRIPLLAEGKHILWVVGWRISEFYKLCDDTKLVLQVRYRQEEKLPPPEPGAQG